jgi:excisionase family DNA binding protein
MPQQPSNTSSDVLTVKELAAMLRVHPVTVRLQAAAGKIPGRQIGNRWRFSRAVIAAWMSEGEPA